MSDSKLEELANIFIEYVKVGRGTNKDDVLHFFKRVRLETKKELLLEVSKLLVITANCKSEHEEGVIEGIIRERKRIKTWLEGLK